MIDFYKTSKRMKKRESILRRDRYMCIECLRYGKVKQALIVHHLTPLTKDNTKAFDNTNLISLCHQCHQKMHDKFKVDTLSSYGVSRERYYHRKLKG